MVNLFVNHVGNFDQNIANTGKITNPNKPSAHWPPARKSCFWTASDIQRLGRRRAWLFPPPLTPFDAAVIV